MIYSEEISPYWFSLKFSDTIGCWELSSPRVVSNEFDLWLRELDIEERSSDFTGSDEDLIESWSIDDDFFKLDISQFSGFSSPPSFPMSKELPIDTLSVSIYETKLELILTLIVSSYSLIAEVSS